MGEFAKVFFFVRCNQNNSVIFYVIFSFVSRYVLQIAIWHGGEILESTEVV